MAKVRVYNLEKAVMKLLEDYGIDISQDIAKGVEELAPQVATKAQTVSASTFPTGTGKYARGWTALPVTAERTYTKATIVNKDQPYLTHLLENGHATRNGGRVKGKKHIKTVQKWAEDALYEEVKKIIND